MNTDNACPLVLTEKFNISPRSYKIKLSTNLPGFLGFVTRHDVFVSFVAAIAFILGLASYSIALAFFVVSGFDSNTMAALVIGSACPLSLFISDFIKKKLEIKADAFVLDWLTYYFSENNIYFSEGDNFTSESDPFRCGFSRGDVNAICKLDNGTVLLAATNGVVLKADIISDYNNEITITATPKEELVFLLRDRKDLLIKFFPNDEKINAALNSDG